MLFLVIYMFLVGQFESEATVLGYGKVSAPLQGRATSGKAVRAHSKIVEVSSCRGDIAIRCPGSKVAGNG